jgi:3-oxoacyl-[acyl-carrier-protein] synthase III
VSADSASGNVKRWLLWKEMDGSCSGLQFKLRMASTNQQQRRKRAPFMVSVRLSRRDWKVNTMTEEEMQVELYAIAHEVVEMEHSLIDRVFEDSSTDVISKEEIKNYINHKANKQLNKAGRYNKMAELLSDQNHIPFRVSVFAGKSKTVS